MKIAIYNDTSTTMHHGCNSVMKVLVDGVQKQAIEIAYLWPVAKDWRNHQEFIRGQRVDGLIVNGEGSIHHSAGRDRARYLCELATFARDQLGVPAFLINASVSALDDETLGHMRNFSGIWVREQESAGYLEAHAITTTVVADLSVGAHFGDPPARGEDILVTDSVLPESREDLADFANRIGAPFESMQENGPARKRGVLQRWRRSLAKRLAPPFQPKSDFKPTTDYALFLQRVASKKLIVTGRFHTVTMCLATETPFIAVASNTRKIESVSKDALGQDDRVIDSESLRTLTEDQLIERYSAYSDDELSHLRRWLVHAAQGRETMFASIRSQLEDL